MSDGKIIYDVDINDDGIEGKLQSTNSKVKTQLIRGVVLLVKYGQVRFGASVRGL